MNLNKKQKIQYWIDFLLVLTQKEIIVKYKHSWLGFIWLIISPLAQIAIIGFIFRFFVPVKVDNYFLFLFTGLLPWNFFSQAITKTTSVIVNERSIIEKGNFPRELIVLAAVLTNFFHLIISLFLLICALVIDKVFFEHFSSLELIQYIGRIFLVTPILLWLLLFTSGLSLGLAALNVRFRDTAFIVQIITPLWFYASPIVYTLVLLPAWLWPFFYTNPMTAIIEGFHFSLLNLSPAYGWLSILSLGISSLIATYGWFFFKKESKYFDDYI